MPSPEEQRKLEEQEELHEALVRLYPALHTILGPDSPTFLAGLDERLAQGDDDQLLEWFRRYPAAAKELDQKRKQLILGRTRGGRLFGDGISPEPGFSYHCKDGKHLVPLHAVFRRDALGRPLCPQHQTVMRLKRR